MNTIKFISSFVLLIFFNLQVKSQNNFKKDSTNIHNTIIKLFDGMREGDSMKVRATFHKDLRMLTSYTTKSGNRKIKKDIVSDFLIAVGTPHEDIWDERIINITIQIDGSLAQAWIENTFYVDDKLSHCGIDAFQLIKDDNNQWKIINLMDTRRKIGCELVN